MKNEKDQINAHLNHRLALLAIAYQQGYADLAIVNQRRIDLGLTDTPEKLEVAVSLAEIGANALERMRLAGEAKDALDAAADAMNRNQQGKPEGNLEIVADNLGRIAKLCEEVKVQAVIFEA